ncbi:MAG TPA: cyclophilin-like fold protein [Nitrososphaeraceae archaeon]|nr:cyclophilin-like fold protein [Nitrososphaeraceae archaeon]
MDNQHTVSSVSRIPVIIQISNKGMAACEMIRHLSPLCVRIILNSLPIQDRIHKISESITYIETKLAIGAEKQKTHFKRGDIAYMTSNSSICIFTKDSVVTPMNHIGIIKSNLEIIEATQSGDVMTLKKM